MLKRIKREVLLPHWEVGPLVVNVLYSLFVGGEIRRGTRRFSLLYVGNERLARSHDVEEVYRIFETEFHSGITSLSDTIFIRGLALARKGQAELLLGMDGQFVREHGPTLQAAGASLLAHEFVPIKDDCVASYHNRALMDGKRIPPADLGLQLAEEPVPLGRIWLLAPQMEEGPISPARSTFHLFENLTRLFDAPGGLQELARLVRSVPSLAVAEPKSVLRVLSGT